MAHYGPGPLPELDLSVDAEDFLFDTIEQLREGATFNQLHAAAERFSGREVSPREVQIVLRELVELNLLKKKIARSSALRTTEDVFVITPKGMHVVEALSKI